MFVVVGCLARLGRTYGGAVGPACPGAARDDVELFRLITGDGREGDDFSDPERLRGAGDIDGGGEIITGGWADIDTFRICAGFVVGDG